MRRLSRTTALKIAGGIAFAVGIFGLVVNVPLLWRGAEAVEQAGDATPYFIVVLGVMLAPIQIIGGLGAWRNQRWGVVLLLLAAAIDIVTAAPGILFAPTPSLRLLAIAAVLLDAAIITLCLWRDQKMAMT